MKLLSIVGARPQFIKLSPLHKAIKKEPHLHHIILHTGQHYNFNLSEVFFKELEIPKPNFHLEVDEPSHASSIIIMQPKIEQILAKETPDVVIVFGDTNSTLAGALAAKKLNIKLAHIEAGLRSFNNAMPEEINRITTDKISDFLFCPTKESISNLEKEGITNNNPKVILCGDIMLDAYNYYADKINDEVIFEKPFILCTLHRQSLVQSPQKLVAVITALNQINKQINIILPAHPRLKQVINELGVPIDFTMIEPVSYLKMIALLKACTLVITDSGGLQKEAFFAKKICITLRDETEWTELVQANVNFLAGDSSSQKITGTFEKAFHVKQNFDHNFYGNGNAAEIIIKELTRMK